MPHYKRNAIFELYLGNVWQNILNISSTYLHNIYTYFSPSKYDLTCKRYGKYDNTCFNYLNIDIMLS